MRVHPINSPESARTAYLQWLKVLEERAVRARLARAAGEARRVDPAGRRNADEGDQPPEEEREDASG